jgi:ATP-dependent DNA ligase
MDSEGHLAQDDRGVSDRYDGGREHKPAKRVSAAVSYENSGEQARCDVPNAFRGEIRDGAIVYRQACQFCCEGIVSKRLGSTYRSGRSKHWIKVKNPAAAAVRREAEEEWR